MNPLFLNPISPNGIISIPNFSSISLPDKNNQEDELSKISFLNNNNENQNNVSNTLPLLKLNNIQKQIDLVSLNSSENLLLNQHNFYNLELGLLHTQTRHLSHNFHLNFNHLRVKLGIDDSRKTHIDSLLKKAKSKCLKAIHEVLKLCLNLLIGRLPQVFITNIKIDFNKIYLTKTIGEIYHEFNLLPTFEDILKKNLIRKGKINLLNEIYNSKFETVYQIYLCSDMYKKDYEKIFNKDGEKIATLYDYVAKNMCEYYLLSKGNKKKFFRNNFLMKKKKLFNINSGIHNNTNNIKINQ
jgi:hypothetical protein